MRIAALIILMLTLASWSEAVAAGAAGDDPMTIIAAQLRDQGYACDRPQSAVQDTDASKPDEAVWIVQCENDKYRVRLDPDLAAKVERLGQ
jgi:hypothetical protein